MLNDKFRVALFDEFLDSFAKLPRAQQKKVNRFVRKFRSDPTNASINYERISTFADPHLRTVRIDQAYRAIVLKPERGNLFVLLWVDHHDEAMAWAARKRFVIHPDTGSLQVLSATPEESAKKLESTRPPPKEQHPIFGQWSDDELTSLGVPAEQLGTVRELYAPEQLDVIADVFPTDAYEALFFLASGESLEAVRQSMAIDAPTVVDPQDFIAALEKPATQRRFVLVADDQELEAILDAPLEKWRTFLHPSQQKLVRAHFNGPARALGGAGTGKTVVAMHRARYLVTEVFKQDADRLLFTTFTNNLARDIQASLAKLCSPATLRRIEVIHLDKWVADYLRGQGYEYRIQYWPTEPLKSLWEKAVALRPPEFSAQFFREEWDYVVQPDGCASYEDYRQASRAGRGVRLSRAQRKSIWPVFEEYRNLLEAKNLRESVDAMRDAANLLVSGHNKPSYRAIIVDEAQDMSTVAFQLLRSIIPIEQPNDLFIVGDGHQRIYRRKVVLKRAGVHIVGRSRKLYINYRTTDEIRKFAVALLQNVDVDDLDGGRDSNSRYKSLFHGQPPTVTPCETFRDEVDAIRDFVAAADASRTCLVTRTNKLLEQYETALVELGVETRRLSRTEADDQDLPGLRLATMHRVKGLEFDRIIIAGVNDGVVPLNIGDLRSDDRAVREEAEMRERALFYVAATRARREVLITSHGKPSAWIGLAGA
ncbi:MAG: UvrD-helicase domain-containing protein [Deltaproteobacteria bacterium]|nr:UvrD-helicase domain-containing protein [Deltaproteobacteria bacterium]